MSAASHTPGPWIVSQGTIGRYRVYRLNERRWEFVATAEPMVSGDERSAAVREADARLIAAAPELLEALEGIEQAWVVGHLRREEPTARGRAALERARAAIAAAKGSS